MDNSDLLKAKNNSWKSCWTNSYLKACINWNLLIIVRKIFIKFSLILIAAFLYIYFIKIKGLWKNKLFTVMLVNSSSIFRKSVGKIENFNPNKLILVKNTAITQWIITQIIILESLGSNSTASTQCRVRIQENIFRAIIICIYWVISKRNFLYFWLIIKTLFSTKLI